MGVEGGGEVGSDQNRHPERDVLTRSRGVSGCILGFELCMHL